jgi:4-hydroxybutyryl-CoA dehydratase/vinylacetyl-CoA-Delta-isomerase
VEESYAITHTGAVSRGGGCVERLQIWRAHFRCDNASGDDVRWPGIASFAAAVDPAEKDIVTAHSDLTGVPVSRYLSLMRTADDIVAVARMKRWAFHQTGTCTGGRCVGGNALNAMWATTFDLDAVKGTDYHQRLQKWLKGAQERDIACCGALTDPKGDRSKSPSQQTDPDMNLRVVERRADGVVVHEKS